MHVLEVSGPHNVAAMLRWLAEEVSENAVDTGGDPIKLSETLKAVIEVDDASSSPVSTLDIRLVRPAEAPFELGVERNLSHPGD